MDLTADQIIAMLQLQRHPTCGYVAQTYHSPVMVPGASLPEAFAGARSLGSVLYFLVTTDAHIVMHKIRSDQMYHFYLGDPLEVLLLYPNGTGEVRVAGSDLAAGMRPQLFIPGDTFHMSRLRPRLGYALLGTSEWVGVEPGDVETGDPDRLAAAYPALRDTIREFMGRPATAEAAAP